MAVRVARVVGAQHGAARRTLQVRAVPAMGRVWRAGSTLCLLQAAELDAHTEPNEFDAYSIVST